MSRTSGKNGRKWQKAGQYGCNLGGRRSKSVSVENGQMTMILRVGYLGGPLDLSTVEGVSMNRELGIMSVSDSEETRGTRTVLSEGAMPLIGWVAWQSRTPLSSPELAE